MGCTVSPDHAVCCFLAPFPFPRHRLWAMGLAIQWATHPQHLASRLGFAEGSLVNSSFCWFPVHRDFLCVPRVPLAWGQGTSSNWATRWVSSPSSCRQHTFFNEIWIVLPVCPCSASDSFLYLLSYHHFVYSKWSLFNLLHGNLSLDWIQTYTDNNVFPLPPKNQLHADFLLELLKGFYQHEDVYQHMLLRRKGLPNARKSKRHFVSWDATSLEEGA